MLLMKQMKTIIGFLALTFALYSCSRESSIDTTNTQRIESGINFVGKFEINENGVRYILYREADGGLFIICPLKDSLSIVTMQKQLTQ